MCRKLHIHGALTTGFRWYFVVVELDVKGDGARYWVLQLIKWMYPNIIEETSD